MQEDIQERVAFLKAMDCIIVNIDNDWSYSEWWNCMYKIGNLMRLKRWCDIAANDDDFTALCATFREIMSKCETAKFVLEN